MVQPSHLRITSLERDAKLVLCRWECGRHQMSRIRIRHTSGAPTSSSPVEDYKLVGGRVHRGRTATTTHVVVLQNSTENPSTSTHDAQRFNPVGQKLTWIRNKRKIVINLTKIFTTITITEQNRIYKTPELDSEEENPQRPRHALQQLCQQHRLPLELVARTLLALWQQDCQASTQQQSKDKPPLALD